MYNSLAKKINFKGINPKSSKIPLEQYNIWDLIQGKFYMLPLHVEYYIYFRS